MGEIFTTPEHKVCCGSQISTVVFLLFLISPVYAAGPGTGSANFLKIPVAARETSLGGALTAAADNANAVYYNPAGLSLIQNPELSFTNNKFIEGVSQQWLAVGYPYKTGAFGFGINYLSVSPFDAYDNIDTPIGSVSAYNLALYLSWGSSLPVDYGLIRSLSYGASLKYISEKLDKETGTGYGLDLGVLAASAVENLKFGFAIENAAASQIKFIENGARPPLKVKTGATYQLRASTAWKARLMLDYVFWTDRPGYLATGLEHNFHDTFAVRVGYSTFGDLSNGLNFGLGINLLRYTGGNFDVDYSFGTTYAFGDIHKLGVTYKFGRLPRKYSTRHGQKKPGAAATQVLRDGRGEGVLKARKRR